MLFENSPMDDLMMSASELNDMLSRIGSYTIKLPFCSQLRIYNPSLADWLVSHNPNVFRLGSNREVYFTTFNEFLVELDKLLGASFSFVNHNSVSLTIYHYISAYTIKGHLKEVVIEYGFKDAHLQEVK